MKYYIFIDDYRKPSDVSWVELPAGAAWIVVKSYTEFVKLFEKIPIRAVAHISYDHDLADAHYAGRYDGERTGYDCAKFIVSKALEEKCDIPDFTVHSLNPVGTYNIMELLNNYRKFQLENSDSI